MCSRALRCVMRSAMETGEGWGLFPAAGDCICTTLGVDVASGVEAEPGRKDHAKVRQFVAEVRA